MWWRRRRQTTYEPGTQAYGKWRPYADSVENSANVMDIKDNGKVYEVSWVKSEAVALEYLRRRDVRQERYYVIVETPYRNLGRDMIMIFDEADGALVEIPERTPLAELTASPTHCARCGYPIMPCSSNFEFPCDDPDCGHPWHTVDFAQTADEVIRAGGGTAARSAGAPPAGPAMRPQAARTWRPRTASCSSRATSGRIRPTRSCCVFAGYAGAPSRSSTSDRTQGDGQPVRT